MPQWDSHSSPSKAQGTSQKRRWNKTASEQDKIILLMDSQQLWVPTQDWVCYPSVVSMDGLAGVGLPWEAVGRWWLWEGIIVS